MLFKSSDYLTFYRKALIMTTATKPRAPVAFTGKGSQARTTALLSCAALAFSSEQSRAAMIDNLAVVLGKSPTAAQIKVTKTETIIGFVAYRLPAGELTKGKTSPADRLDRARDIVLNMATPPKEGTKARKLRAGQTGRRNAVQQRIVRAAEQRASQLFAEIGASNAQTQGTKNAKAKATRAPSMAGSGKGKAPEPTPPTHLELVKPAPAVTSANYVQHMQVQLAALVAYDAKNAKKRPVSHGEFAEKLLELKQLANKAANTFAERQARAQAMADAA